MIEGRYKRKWFFVDYGTVSCLGEGKCAGSTRLRITFIFLRSSTVSFLGVSREQGMGSGLEI
jgi:hypothetical protein